MARTYDAIVIGGGVIGASTAFHLARAGVGRVALVERRTLCSGNTRKSGAIVRMGAATYAADTSAPFVALGPACDFAKGVAPAEAEIASMATARSVARERGTWIVMGGRHGSYAGPPAESVGFSRDLALGAQFLPGGAGARRPSRWFARA